MGNAAHSNVLCTAGYVVYPHCSGCMQRQPRPRSVTQENKMIGRPVHSYIVFCVASQPVDELETGHTSCCCYLAL